jgi:hypothetical protein
LLCFLFPVKVVPVLMTLWVKKNLMINGCTCFFQ